MKRRRLKRRIDVRLTASIPCFSGTEFYVYTYTKVDEHVMINKGGAWAAGVETSCIGILRLPLLFLLLGMFTVIGVEADGTHTVEWQTPGKKYFVIQVPIRAQRYATRLDASFSIWDELRCATKNTPSRLNALNGHTLS